MLDTQCNHLLFTPIYRWTKGAYTTETIYFYLFKTSAYSVKSTYINSWCIYTPSGVTYAFFVTAELFWGFCFSTQLIIHFLSARITLSIAVQLRYQSDINWIALFSCCCILKIWHAMVSVTLGPLCTGWEGIAAIQCVSLQFPSFVSLLWTASKRCLCLFLLLVNKTKLGEPKEPHCIQGCSGN